MNTRILKLASEGKSTRLIARELCIGQTTVRYWLKKAGIKTKPNKDCWANCCGLKQNKGINWAVVQEFYNNGGTYKSITNKFKLCATAIRNAAKSGLLKTRNASDALKIGVKLGRVKSPKMSSAWLSKRMTQLFAEHPELHPNRKVAGNRKNMTYPERLAFDYLTNSGVKFEHNGRVGKYWVDFLIREHNLGIEVDGARWHNAEYDNNRDAEIARTGIKIVRIPAKTITTTGPSVLGEILSIFGV